jgi:hypothetical protein
MIIGLGVSIAGVLLAFRANEGGDGRAFIERYACLAIPLLVRMYVSYVVLWYLLLILIPAARPMASTVAVWNPFAAVIQLLLLIWYFAALRTYLGRAAGNPAFVSAA